MDTLGTSKNEQQRPLIVVADDERTSLKVLSAVVEKVGRLIAVSSGADALAAVLANKPDLVVLDWQLGDASGIDICRQLKAMPEFADTPIIIVTSNNDAESEIGAMEAGAADFVTKPIHQRVLLSRVQAHLRQGLYTRELARAAKQTKEQKKLLRAITRHLPAGVAYWDRDEICQFCNAAYANLYGKSIQEIEGSQYCNLAGEEAYNEVSPLIQQVLQGVPKTFDSLLGKDAIVYFIPDTNPDGARGFIVVDWDISELRATQRKLSTVAALNSQIVENTDHGLVVYHGAGERILFNRVAEQILDGNLDNYLQKNLDLAPNRSNAAFAAVALNCLKRGVSRNFDFDFETAQAETRSISVNFVSFQNDQIPHLLITLRDVTKYRQAEAALRDGQLLAEQANRAKSEFLANMSHEIRTPMNAIIGLTHTLLRNSTNEDEQERLRQISGSSAHLLQLVNNTLDLSKIEAGHFELERNPLSIRNIADEVIGIISERIQDKNLDLQLELLDSDTLFWGDSTRLRQALLNYIGNAAKFTERGSIRIRIAAEEKTDNRVKLHFSVSDTGPGFDSNASARLFNAFEQLDNSVTRTHGGTGLGLVITKHIAEMMGGEVGASSEMGVGSTFWFSAWLEKCTENIELKPILPKDDNAFIEEKVRLLKSPAKILLVEDNPVNQMVALGLLESVGLHAVVADNGEEAVALAKGSDFDLILMDVQMPVMDGLEASKLIRTLAGYAATPIIALTANAFSEDIAKCRAAGMNDHISKPIPPARFYQVLFQTLSNLQDTAVADKTLTRTGEQDSPPSPQMPCPPASPEIKPLDLSQIEGMDMAAGLRNANGKQKNLHRLLASFAETAPDIQKAINVQHESADLEGLRKLAHFVRGSSITVGAMNIWHAAEQLETLCKGERDTTSVDDAVDQLQTSIEMHCRQWAAAINSQTHH